MKDIEYTWHIEMFSTTQEVSSKDRINWVAKDITQRAKQIEWAKKSCDLWHFYLEFKAQNK